MLRILKQILVSYDDLIMDRLTRTKIYPSKMRKGLGRHVRKDDAEERFCRGRKVYRRGHRNRKIKTVFGVLDMRVRRAECLTCGSRYSPLLNALQVAPYSRKETNVEHEVTEAVIDTNYRRLIEGRSIDISLGGVHNIVVGSDIDKAFQDRIPAEDLSGIMADGTGVKQHKGSKGELRTVIGISQQGRVVPLGSFVNDSWPEIENVVKARIKGTTDYPIPFVYDGEPGLDDFLSGAAEVQRCTWHAPRGLYHAL
ncbi:MAG: transposase [Desulfobacteraceae bacterium]|nr:transposase [Desulfobacteraceae bacterium]